MNVVPFERLFASSYLRMYSTASKVLATPTARQLAGVNNCAMSTCKSSAVTAMRPWGQAAFEDSGTYIQAPKALICGLKQTRRHRL